MRERAKDFDLLSAAGKKPAWINPGFAIALGLGGGSVGYITKSSIWACVAGGVFPFMWLVGSWDRIREIAIPNGAQEVPDQHRDSSPDFRPAGTSSSDGASTVNPSPH